MTINSASFERDLHLHYMLCVLDALPHPYQHEDSNRLTLAYFAISGLDILNALDRVDFNQVIDWVYAAQVLPLEEVGNRVGSNSSGNFFGFRGSPSIGTRFSSAGGDLLLHDGGHLASTYSALAILRILGDDFSRVERNAIVTSMRTLQQPDGSFTSMHTGAETDLRFVFCAVAISAMLNDWTGVDSKKALEYILSCQSYDDGFGLCPGLESHGGATYCAVSALKLMGYIVPDPNSGLLTSLVLDLNALIKWCVQKQTQAGGFQGRSNKPPDACYAFWVGGLLNLLEIGHLYKSEALRTFQLSCQSKLGGFSKWPGEWQPDILHAYYGLCGFSLLEEPGLKSLVCELGITKEAAEKHSGACIVTVNPGPGTSSIW